ncbi:MAG: HTH domain-containing protein [Desulfovibrio sp.]|nr:HTH domain-containing protein [Desulfovibrio sp.]
MSEKILAFLQSDPLHTVSQLAKALGVTTRTVERMIATLRKEGRLRRIGPAKGGRWEVVQ